MVPAPARWRNIYKHLSSPAQPTEPVASSLYFIPPSFQVSKYSYLVYALRPPRANSLHSFLRKKHLILVHTPPTPNPSSFFVFSPTRLSSPTFSPDRGVCCCSTTALRTCVSRSSSFAAHAASLPPNTTPTAGTSNARPSLRTRHASPVWRAPRPVLTPRAEPAWGRIEGQSFAEEKGYSGVPGRHTAIIGVLLGGFPQAGMPISSHHELELAHTFL